jgi:hypothetical protein
VPTRPFAVLGLCLALGLAVFGLQMARAIKKGRDFDRYLTVRGLAEREVKATIGIWPLRFASFADALPELKRTIESNRALVLDYLKAEELPPGDLSFGLPEISDRSELPARDGQPPLPRYKAVLTIVVRSAQVDRVKKAIQQIDALLEKGVTLVSSDYDNKIEFEFDRVNDLKPDMIREATASARAAAEKFAQDSHAKVGAIRRATQGAVEIEDLDVATPERKVLRVVTTVDFFLE